jgi:outer membrane protein assembly factor BamB/ABC-type phosphate/phosphonate transport system substrate-binding protein
MRHQLFFCLAIAINVLVYPCFAADSSSPLVMVVMDPLAAPLSCPCVQGHAQRQYDKLGAYLEKQLHRPLKVLFAESLSKIVGGKNAKNIDLIIGKRSLVKFDAKINQLPIREMAMLTGKDGKTTFTGLFVVPQDDPAKKLEDLKGYKVFFGPPDCDEKFKAAADALVKAGIELPEKLETRPGCSDAVLEMLEHPETPTAAVISSYAASLLEGCGTIKKGAIRIIGETEPGPFVTVFAMKSMEESLAADIAMALEKMKAEPELLSALESKNGFVIIEEESVLGEPSPQAPTTAWCPPKVEGSKAMKADALASKVTDKAENGWPSWRGPHRDGVVAHLPARLSSEPHIVWQNDLTGAAISGVVVSGNCVLVADRDAADTSDIFRCFDVDAGVELWNFEYATSGNIKDYGNAPRATPIIHDGKVYTMGGLGDLHCLNLTDGEILWKKNLVTDFGGAVPTWGYCSSPLLVDDKIIVNPGARQASLVALDRVSGKEIWRSPGLPAAYSSFIVGTFGGVRQIVGYDEKSLGGWEIATGKRLWTLVPPQSGDFNVPTPIDAGGKLLVSSENNGTRLYGFESSGIIDAKPLAANAELAPDSSTPALASGKVFGCWNSLYCLKANGGLRALWTGEDDAFSNYACIIASSDRVLVISSRGELLLIDALSDKFEVLSRLKVFADESEVLSHPALMRNRLYIRNGSKIVCLELAEE